MQNRARVPTPTMGDYVGTTDGAAFGYLYPTWSQPIISSAPGGTSGCVTCNGAPTPGLHTLRVMGNTVLP
jgi:hypothetical protein